MRSFDRRHLKARRNHKKGICTGRLPKRSKNPCVHTRILVYVWARHMFGTNMQTRKIRKSCRRVCIVIYIFRYIYIHIYIPICVYIYTEIYMRSLYLNRAATQASRCPCWVKKSGFGCEVLVVESYSSSSVEILYTSVLRSCDRGSHAREDVTEQPAFYQPIKMLQCAAIPVELLFQRVQRQKTHTLAPTYPRRKTW